MLVGSLSDRPDLEEDGSLSDRELPEGSLSDRLLFTESLSDRLPLNLSWLESLPLFLDDRLKRRSPSGSYLSSRSRSPRAILE